jgi:hypothetical protein
MKASGLNDNAFFFQFFEKLGRKFHLFIVGFLFLRLIEIVNFGQSFVPETWGEERFGEGITVVFFPAGEKWKDEESEVFQFHVK